MKMFKNCPYEKYGRKECTGCPRFKKCLFKKLKRKLKKHWKIVWMAMIIFLLILVACLITRQAKNEQRNRWLEERSDVCLTTNEITTNKFEVITVSSQATVNPTSTPKTEIEKQTVKKLETTKTARTTSIPKAKATQRPKKIKAKKVVNVAKTKNLSSNFISSKILKDYASLSEYDRKLMEKMVYAESRGEPYEGKVAVASVILNRYIFNKKKISIEDIVTAKYQFADISNVTQEMLDEYPDCKKAVEDAISGNDPTRNKFPEGARYFYRPEWVSEYQKKIREGVPVLIIGHHHFHNDFNE